jgi:hypothetical protein
MSKLLRSRPSFFAYFFFVTLLVTVALYLLRGLGPLTFIPGGIILGAITLTVLAGILYGIERTRRF